MKQICDRNISRRKEERKRKGRGREKKEGERREAMKESRQIGALTAFYKLLKNLEGVSF